MRNKRNTRRKRPNGPAKLQTSAMLDIVFLLLIYFVATAAPTLLESHMRADLPSPGPSTPVPPEAVTLLNVAVKQEGYYIQGRFRDLASLQDDLVMIATYSPDTTVMVSVDPDAMNTQVMALLDTARHAGLPNVAFAGRPREL